MNITAQFIAENRERLILVGTAIGAFLFFTLFLFLLSNLRNQDYSDQTGARNFSNPQFACVAFLIIIQIVVCVIIIIFLSVTSAGNSFVQELIKALF